jgi:enamine deaminase RidA (YjgF/YER057c/UK114 family)
MALMVSRTGLHLEYLSPAELTAARWAGLLGVATFEGDLTGPAATLIPSVRIDTPVLGASGMLCELWSTTHPVETGVLGRLRYSRSAGLLFGVITVSESAAPAAATPRTPLYEATEQAYREIFSALTVLGYPHLVRIWNYIPEINRDTHGTERYKQFNSARLAAMLAARRPVTGNVSAACALGASLGSPLVVYFLASAQPATSIENPRQVSAYHYPPQYGVHSPIFSRAAVHRDADGLTLFISGTASIVGHQTLHAGDPAAQTRETLTNIEALLAETNRVTGSREFTLETLACKVYVRYPSELPIIQRELRSALGPCARAIYLQADICRRDLSVEIEATAMVGTAAKSRTPVRQPAAEHSI